MTLRLFNPASRFDMKDMKHQIVCNLRVWRLIWVDLWMEVTSFMCVVWMSSFWIPSMILWRAKRIALHSEEWTYSTIYMHTKLSDIYHDSNSLMQLHCWGTVSKTLVVEVKCYRHALFTHLLFVREFPHSWPGLLCNGRFAMHPWAAACCALTSAC